MFDKQQESLIERKKESATTTPATNNAFVKAGLKKSAETRSGNNALKYSTTGNDFVDQFANAGSFKTPRKYDEIARDQAALWGSNPVWAVAFIIYLRIVTRVVQLFNGTRTKEVQRGAGLKHESIMRMIWLHLNHPETFWKNIPLFISVGSWKDVMQMLAVDLKFNGWKGRVLDWKKFEGLIKAGLENPKHRQLLLKYLPTIKSNKQCNTLESQADNVIGKWICSFLFGGKDNKESSQNYKQYRQLKSSGTAHQWQQLISKKLMQEINFDTVHGRALAQLVSGKFLANQHLEKKYEEWLSKKPVVKFTGYLPELLLNHPSKMYQIQTFNKQFLGVVETAKKGATQITRFMTVVDTSGSMHVNNSGIKLKNADVAKCLALFFSYMFEKGPFANTWYEFHDRATLHQIKGSTPWEKWQDMQGHNHTGGTNFQSVVDHMCNIKKSNPSISEDEFPNGFLILSDMEFNPATYGIGSTNTEVLFKKLSAAGFSSEFVGNFKLVFWNLHSNYYGPNTGKKFDTYGDVKNVFYFGGYDGAIIAFLTGIEGKTKDKKIETASDLFKAAMEQEIMSYIEL